MADMTQVLPQDTEYKQQFSKIGTTIGPNNTLMFPKRSSVTLIVRDPNSI